MLRAWMLHQSSPDRCLLNFNHLRDAASSVECGTFSYLQLYRERECGKVKVDGLCLSLQARKVQGPQGYARTVSIFFFQKSYPNKLIE